LVALAAVLGLVGLGVSMASAAGTSSTQTSSATEARIAAVIDPGDWYLTLPTGRKGHPDTIEMPDLADYSSSYFRPDDDSIVFTANAGGVTTSGSSYPRSELREMNGSKLASWSATRGTHTLTARQAVTALPKAKPEVVTAQIHDSSDDVMEIRLEGSRLSAQLNNGKTDITLDAKYKLGTTYDLTITAANGRIRVYYNGAKKVDLAKSGSGWYFKAGSYVQSNTSKGDKAGAVGTVVVYRLAVTHT